MPVLPLVGSISSLPGFSTLRFSASQIMDAPMRHFTEYAGLRPSILASSVAGLPSQCGSGAPAACGRCSKNCLRISSWLYLPVRHKSGALLFPGTLYVDERSLVEYIRHRAIDPVPHVRKRRFRLPPDARFFVPRALDKPEHFPHFNGVGRTRQQISTLGPAARFHKTALFQAGQNQFKKFLGDLLSPGDVGNLDGLSWRLRREVK